MTTQLPMWLDDRGGVGDAIVAYIVRRHPDGIGTARLAALLGVSEERVQRIERDALIALARELREHSDLVTTPVGRRPRRNEKLTREKVVRLRELFAAGEAASVVAAQYGLHVHHVRKVVRGDAWLDADGPVVRRKAKGPAISARTREMLRACIEGGSTQSEVARRFGVSVQRVNFIVRSQVRQSSEERRAG